MGTEKKLEGQEKNKALIPPGQRANSFFLQSTDACSLKGTTTACAQVCSSKPQGGPRRLEEPRVEHVAEEPHAGTRVLKRGPSMQRDRPVRLGVHCGVSETQDAKDQGCGFPLDLKNPLEYCEEAPLNGRLLPEKVTTCARTANPGNRDWKPFLHQKDQSQAKGVIGKERKDSSAR
ncbi:hypothetical protein DUI87_03661 [Hirundo rustica rustica]|uniref:Uncharacterized protein n=1 Tax=Hirundo rustica rustica TaxID=333673 RepID=A0A3M0LJ15_HIRRU|nr:hypothetical protein DUI87_03661 [Hirundo rustica rustica]